MSGDNELDEVWARARGALGGVIQSSTMLAEAIIEARVAALRRAAERDRELAQQAREQARLLHQADAAVWRAVMRPQWWREAGAEDIGRVWRATSTWQHVDARAAAARQVVVDRLAERGVHVDARAQTRPGPDDVAWLSDALDRAAAERGTPAAAEPGPPEAGAAGPLAPGSDRRDDPAGEARRQRAQDRAAREDQAAAHVRAVWPAERAEKVIGCRAWGALAYQLAQLEDQGHDVPVLLYGVSDFVDRAHTPAAFAFRSIEERLENAGGGERVAAEAQRAGERDERAARSHAETQPGPGEQMAGATQPDRTGQTEVSRAQQQADLHADRAATHEARAAQLAAQGFPTSTKEAVTATAEQARSGAAAASTTVTAQRAAPARQHSRPEPKGR